MSLREVFTSLPDDLPPEALYYAAAGGVLVMGVTLALLAPFVAAGVRERAQWRPLDRFDDKGAGGASPVPRRSALAHFREAYAAGGIREVYAGAGYLAASTVLVVALAAAAAFFAVPLLFIPFAFVLLVVAGIPITVGHVRSVLRGREIKWWETYTIPGVLATSLLEATLMVGFFTAEILAFISLDEEAYLPAAGYFALFILCIIPMSAVSIASTRLIVDSEATGRPPQLPPYTGLADCLRRIISEEGPVRFGPTGRLWAWLLA